MLPSTFQPESYRLASHHGMSEATLNELAAVEIEIQRAYDDEALVEIEIVPEREVGEDTIKVARTFILEDFIRTMKLPIEAVQETTSRFVKRSAPYERVELVPEASVEPSASGSDWSRRLEPAEFAAAMQPPVRPVGVETGWFTHTDAALPPLDEYFPPPPAAATPSKALWIAGAIVGGVVAVGVGIAIAMIAL